MRSGVIAMISGMCLAACSLALDFDSRPGANDGGTAASSSSGGSSGGGSSGTSSSGSSGTEAGGDSGAIDSPSGCPGTAGPAPVRAGTLCIDGTEVTNAQYAAFLATSPNTANQPSNCAGNTTFTPAQGWPAGAGKENDPVVEIDWCDARAFCKWSGKELCTKSQWDTGCAANIAGMSGGVMEWIDDCSSDNCPARGGGGCSASVDEARISAHEDVGFRCCTP